MSADYLGEKSDCLHLTDLTNSRPEYKTILEKHYSICFPLIHTVLSGVIFSLKARLRSGGVKEKVFRTQPGQLMHDSCTYW